jgi:hypothetical protein
MLNKVLRAMIAFHFFSLLLALTAHAAEPARPLFDGKSLAGWVHEGPTPTFSASNGELRTSGLGQTPDWLRTTAEYEDFRLTFDYKLDQWAEAAIILRAPRTARPQHAGITLVLTHDFHNESTPHITGAILAVRPPQWKMPEPETWGRWHRVEIELRGARLTATIDGHIVQDLDTSTIPALAHRLRRGHIGFPDMGYGYAVRNIEITDLGRPTNLVDLLPAASLDGWSKRGDSGHWTLPAEATIQGANGHSILYAPPTFGDFEFTAAVRSQNRVNGGVFLRGDPEGPRRGFEIQIYSPVDSVYPTGSIYGRARARISADLENRWFLLQVRVQGARVQVWIDGEPAAAFDNLPEAALAPGRIGLQIHSDNATVQFRDLRARPLD